MDVEAPIDAAACSSRSLFWRRVCAGLTLALAIVSGYHTVLTIFAQTLQACFNVSVVQLGFLLSVGLVPSSLASLLTGLLIGRSGSQRMMQISLVAVMASGYNALTVASQAYLASLFPDNPRRVFSLYLAMNGLGGILLPLWAQWLLQISRDSPTVEFSRLLHAPFAVIGVLMACSALLFRDSTPRASLRVPENAAWKPGLRLSAGGNALLLAWIVLAASDIGVSIWVPRVLASFDLPSWLQPGYVMAAFMAAYFLSRMALAFLPEGAFPSLSLIAPGMVGGLIFLCGIFLGNVVVLAASFVLGGLIWSIQAPSILSALSKREGDRFGWAISLGMVGASIVGFAVANIMGVLAGRLGEQRMSWILVLPAVGYPLAGVIVFLFNRTRHKQDEQLRNNNKALAST